MAGRDSSGKYAAVGPSQRPIGSNPAADAQSIRKLIIYHSGLLPSGGSDGLDESASLEELAEHILYYYDANLHDNTIGSGGGPITDGESSANRHSTENAVKFVGLLTALFNLPSSLNSAMSSSSDDSDENINHDDEDKHDDAAHTKQVHLANSTLVFVPLEQEYIAANTTSTSTSSSQGQGGLMAAVQIARSGGDPVATRAMIQRHHMTFCLFKGGSVHHRLMMVDDTSLSRCSGDRQRSSESNSNTDAKNNKEDEDDYGSNNGDGSGYSQKVIDDLGAAIASAASVEAARAVALEDRAWEDRWALDDINQEGDDAETGQSSSMDIRKSGANRRDGRVEAISLVQQQSRTAVAHGSGGECEQTAAAQNTAAAAAAAAAYPGMAQLYALRKKHRKLNDQLMESRTDPELYDENYDLKADSKERLRVLENKLKVAQERVDELLQVLPITTIRSDLATYYDEMIADIANKRALAGECVGRCIVDLVPTPGPSDMFRFSCPPCEPPPSTAATLSRMIRSLLKRSTKQQGRSLRNVDAVNLQSDVFVPILAISCFYHGQLLFSNTAEEEDGDEGPVLYLTNDTASLLYQHLCRRGRNDGSKAQGGRGSIGDTDEEQSRKGKIGSFMRPPSIALSTRDPNFDLAESLSIPSLGDDVLWVPRVTLPFYAQGDRTKVVDERISRVALYEYKEYDFVIFINEDGFSPRADIDVTGDAAQQPTSPNRPDASSTTISSLVSLSRQLEENLWRICSRTTYGLHSDQAHGEAGADIIFIDRLADKVVLFNNGTPVSGSDVILAQNSTVNQKEADSSRAVSNDIDNDMDQKQSNPVMHYGNDLDCRHLLASRLPLDIILALDEMMKEVRRASSNSEGPAGVSARGSRVIELCTFLPQGWVYCRAHQHREMYGVFDPNIYVTLADVQKATARIRKSLGGVLL